MTPMRGYKSYFTYRDDPVLEWVNARTRAIRVCLESSLPEAAITLIYSGIDTIGLLDAPEKQLDARKKTFISWAGRYLASSLQTIDGDTVRAIDLYSARCGILHISSPMSQLSRTGKAREIFYQFGAATAGHQVPPKVFPLVIELESFERAFREGCNAFLTDLKTDKARSDRAARRVEKLLRWGMLAIMSDAEIEEYRAAQGDEQLSDTHSGHKNTKAHRS